MSALRVNSTTSIPFLELEFKTSRSSGAGGQHVNTSDTRVTLSWNFANSPSLSTQQKDLFIMQKSSHLTSRGWIHISCGNHRSQKQNKDECIKRLVQLLKAGLIPPKKRVPTKIPRTQKKKRLDIKKQRGHLKKLRSKPDY